MNPHNWNPRQRLLAFTSIATTILVSDQLTKIWAVETLKNQPDRDYLGGTIKLLYAENTGAWGSLGSDWPEPVKLVVMTALPLVVLAYFAYRVVKDHSMRFNEGLAYSLIVSGGLGNIIDRIQHKYVVDFLWMGVGPLTTNIFNIADVAIVAAMGFLLWEAWVAHKLKKQAEKSEEASS